MPQPSLRRGVLWTGLGSVASLGFLFAETIVVARLLPPAEFGAYVLLIAAVNFLLMAVDFGAKGTVTQLIAAGERPQQAAVVGSALLFRLAVLAGLGAALLVARPALVLLDSSETILTFAAYLPLMLAAASLDELLFAMLQGFQSFRAMAAAQAIRGASRLALSVGLLLWLELGVLALVHAWTLSFALAAVYQFAVLPTGRRPSWRWSLVREMLRFGLPLQLTRVLWFVSGRIHVLLLAALAGPASVAFYAVAARVPEALQNLSDSYVRVYFPTMTRMLAAGQRAEAARVLDQSLRLVSIGGALAALGAVLFGDEIVRLLFSDQYAASAPAFALLMLALHMTMVVNVMGYTLTAAGHPGQSLAVDAVRASANGLVDLLLIPVLAVTGAAGAAVVASYAGAPLAVRALRRRGIPPTLAPRLRETLALLVCAGLHWLLQPALPYRLAILALFLVLSGAAAALRPTRGQLVRADGWSAAGAAAEPVAPR